MQRTDIYCKYTKAGLRDRAQTTADIVGVTLTPGDKHLPCHMNMQILYGILPVQQRFDSKNSACRKQQSQHTSQGNCGAPCQKCLVIHTSDSGVNPVE